MDTLLTDLFAAYFDARRHKRNSKSQLIFEQNFESNLMEMYRSIVDRTYRVRPSSCFMVFKPVKREVFAADFRDRVVHHLIFNYIAPMFERSFINDSYSCRTGRGTLYGVRRLDYHIKSCSRNGTCDAWILKLDIQGYFMNIDRMKLFEKVWSTILKNRRRTAPDGRKWGEKLDYRLLEYLLREIIFNDPTQNCIVKGSVDDWIGLPPDKSLFHTPKGCGLPIGNLTSQLFSNIYLSDFDNYCKRDLKLKHYGRYVDDFFVIHNSKDYLRELVGIFDTYLREQLSLKLHPKKRYLQHYTHGVSFLGSKMNGHSILMGERIRKGAMQVVSTVNRSVDGVVDGELPSGMPVEIGDFVQHMNSYLGLMVHGNSYDLRQRLMQRVSPFVLQWVAPNVEMTKMVILQKPTLQLFDPLNMKF